MTKEEEMILCVEGMIDLREEVVGPENWTEGDEQFRDFGRQFLRKFAPDSPKATNEGSFGKAWLLKKLREMRDQRKRHAEKDSANYHEAYGLELAIHEVEKMEA